MVSETEHLDAIVVLTSIPSHAEIVIKAIEAGYNIIFAKNRLLHQVKKKKTKEVAEKTMSF